LKCRGTGYFGRSAIYEILPISEAIQCLISSESDLRKIRDVAREEGMITLRENAVKKLLDGTTTYQEVLKVTWEQI